MPLGRFGCRFGGELGCMDGDIARSLKPSGIGVVGADSKAIEDLVSGSNFGDDGAGLRDN